MSFKGSRSRTRACKRSSSNNGETYSTFRKFVRAVDEQCQCEGESVETESCKPKVSLFKEKMSQVFFVFRIATVKMNTMCLQSMIKEF
jgi:hypothetical protein